MHVMSGLLHADVAALLFEFILPTAVAKCKVLTERVIAVRQVDPIFDIFIIVVFVCVARLALEAMLTLPLLWNICDLWLKAERVVWSITSPTEVELVLIRCLSAKLT